MKKRVTASNSPAARVAALLDRKLPGCRQPPLPMRGKRPSWMREDVAELLAHVGPQTLLGLYGCRLMSKDECLESRALFDRVDERGEWFGASWQPFLQDPGGSVTCLDTDTGAVIYHDKMAGPLLVAPSLAAYLQVVEAVLVKLPDPPDPDEDDVVEEELEERFERALRKRLIASGKTAPKPRPRR